jgi:sarcosine oxidase, subunit beta
VKHSSADVVIIGGGVMGASAAFHMAEAGLDVVLLERGDLAGGSTSKAAGGIRANFSDRRNIALGQRSLELFGDFPNRPGQEIDMHRSGYLFILTTDEQVADFGAAIELQRQMGLDAHIVDAKKAKELSPYLAGDDVVAAAWTPNDGHCSPESVVYGYARGARSHGARVYTGTAVHSVTCEGTQITAVCAQDMVIKTNVIVNCAGAWSPQIAQMVGCELPVTPYRRELLITEPLPYPVETAFTIDATTSLYWHREGPGMLTGFSDREVSPGFDCSRDPLFPEKLAELAEHRAPALLDLGVKAGWAGLYEVTPDHNALLGEFTGISRMLYATGFSGHGFLQGPAVGEILRDCVLGREPFIDIRDLSADRFESGHMQPELHIV